MIGDQLPAEWPAEWRRIVLAAAFPYAAYITQVVMGEAMPDFQRAEVVFQTPRGERIVDVQLPV